MTMITNFHIYYNNKQYFMIGKHFDVYEWLRLANIVMYLKVQYLRFQHN